MIFEILANGQTTSFDLNELAGSCSGIITIGRECKEVWNAIPINDESADPFQCHVIGSAGTPYRLHHGQERTECPKGLMSNKLIPCNGCMGRCVNIRAGRPKYYLRTPDTPTLINGKPVGEFGTILNAGDKISFGNVLISVQ